MRKLQQPFEHSILSAAFAACAALSTTAVFAQDSSGDSPLNASFRFRYLAIANESN